MKTPLIFTALVSFFILGYLAYSLTYSPIGYGYKLGHTQIRLSAEQQSYTNIAE